MRSDLPSGTVFTVEGSTRLLHALGSLFAAAPGNSTCAAWMYRSVICDCECPAFSWRGKSSTGKLSAT